MVGGTLGTPHPILGWGTSPLTWDGVPPYPGMGYPPGPADGVPPIPTLGWGTPLWPEMGYPHPGIGYTPGPGMGYPPDLGWGTPRTWDGVPPAPQTWDGVPPQTWDGLALPPTRQISIASTCYMAGGMPLAFTQEDFLVKLMPCSNYSLFSH